MSSTWTFQDSGSRGSILFTKTRVIKQTMDESLIFSSLPTKSHFLCHPSLYTPRPERSTAELLVVVWCMGTNISVSFNGTSRCTSLYINRISEKGFQWHLEYDFPFSFPLSLYPRGFYQDDSSLWNHSIPYLVLHPAVPGHYA